MGHKDEVIDRALRAMGRALAAGADGKSAMQAALTAAASTACLHEYSVVVDGVRLTVGFDGDIEDGWVIKVDAGTDLAGLTQDGGRLYQIIDSALIDKMKREAAHEARDRIEERHADLRAQMEVMQQQKAPKVLAIANGCLHNGGIATRNGPPGRRSCRG